MLLKSRADYRAIEALARPQSTFDYSTNDEFWLDYVADVGDGWNSTFAIASLLARPSLALGGRETPRGQVLVMGGDQVYPFASRNAYEERLVAPYAKALPTSNAPPDLFAIPGNHDWYDGLGSFMRLFSQNRTLGAWRTRQSRSYFALQLPHRWWLIAVDVQLEADIDHPQLEYFREVASEMRVGDRVILCTAEPFWVYGEMYDPALEKNLAYFEERVLQPVGAQVVLRLAGDQHHYRHHASATGSHLITAGGGGAFLHPTHTLPEKPLSLGSVAPETFHLAAEFPTRGVSWRLAWRDFLCFPYYNRRFGLLSAGAYGLLASALPAPSNISNPWIVLTKALRSLASAPMGMVLCAGVIAGFVLFTDTHNKLYRVVAGILHGMAHLIAAFGLAWAIGLAVHEGVHGAGEATHQFLRLAGVTIAGYFAGGLIFGWYLLISVNGFKRHGNEAFSALRIEGYKNFLRLHFDAQGALTVYAVKLENVPNYGDDDSRTYTLNHELIEPPFTVGRDSRTAEAPEDDR